MICVGILVVPLPVGVYLWGFFSLGFLRSHWLVLMFLPLQSGQLVERSIMGFVGLGLLEVADVVEVERFIHVFFLGYFSILFLFAPVVLVVDFWVVCGRC